MLEILAPAGSPEGVVAAVQNGADAVYLGYTDYSARQKARNFTAEEYSRASEYCRIRGVSVYLALNALISDNDMSKAIQTAIDAAKAGTDGIIVSDLGLLHALRQALPEMPLHCGANMNIHNAEGVRIAAAMGATRAVLAKELSFDEIAEIAKDAKIQLEVFAHGQNCISYCGQCYLSAVQENSSANKGVCTTPCRLQYNAGGRRDSLSLGLKDNCLVTYVEDLARIGVSSLKIEGRLRRPEYTALVTGVYSRAAHEKQKPTEAELELMNQVFSPYGLTDGYLHDRENKAMFRDEGAMALNDSQVFHTLRKNYLSGEFQRVPVRFAAEIRRGQNARLIAADDLKNTATDIGQMPEPAFYRATDSANVATALHRTEGTPFYCAGVKSIIDPDLMLAPDAISAMRQRVLNELLEKRRRLTDPAIGEYIPDLADKKQERPPVFTVSVTRANQLSRQVLDFKPDILYIPLGELVNGKAIRPFLEDKDIKVAAILPKVVFDSQWKRVNLILKAAKKAGISDILVSNAGHILPLREQGFTVRGDTGFNIYSSHSLNTAYKMGLSSLTLSFEMNYKEIENAVKPVDTEIIVYGRTPMLYTETCIIKEALGVCSCEGFRGIRDERGVTLPVMRESDDSCRNIVYSPKKVFIPDRLGDFSTVWGHRIAFTTENAEECASVLKRYIGLGQYEPGGIWRGLYYKGVQ